MKPMDWTHSWGCLPSFPEALGAVGCAPSYPYASSPLWSLVGLQCCNSLGLVSCLGHPLLVPDSMTPLWEFSLSICSESCQHSDASYLHFLQGTGSSLSAQDDGDIRSACPALLCSTGQHSSRTTVLEGRIL